VGIEYDAEQRPASRSLGAVGQEGIVGEHGTDAGEDGVGGVAKALNLIAGGGPGEPVRLVGESRCGRGSKLTVSGERSLESDEGTPCPDEVREGFVEAARFVLKNADGDLDACGPESFDAAAADERVGVGGGCRARG